MRANTEKHLYSVVIIKKILTTSVLFFIREGDLKILLDKSYYPDVMFLPRDGFLVEPCLGSNIWARDYDA